LNTVGKALLILGVVLAIGGGLLFWKTKVQSASTWTNVSKDEMETILKDLNPAMIKQISSTPDGKKKITDELKQLLAFAAEARKVGLADDPATKQQLDMMRSQITAQFYDKETHKGEQMPPFGFIKPEQVEEFYTKAGSSEKFDEFLKGILEDARKGGKLPEGQEPSEDEVKQLKDAYAKISIYNDEANAKMASGELGEDFKKRLDLQLKLQQSSFLAQKYASEKLAKNAEVTDDDIKTYIAANPEYDMSGKKGKAEEILAKVKAGEDFAKLADENTEDPGNKNQQTGKGNGGLYKFTDKDSLDPAFKEAMTKLEPGKIADNLVESSFGYHIMKLDGKETKKDKDGKDETTYNVRHILISNMYQDKENPMSRPMPVKDAVKAKLQKEKQEKVVADIVAKNQIAVAEDFELPQVSDEDLKKMQQQQGMPPGGPGGAEGGQQIDPKQMEQIKKQIEAQQKGKAPAGKAPAGEKPSAEMPKGN
jgi:parvulin-like peptidyl-prolyl isomerase